MRKFIFIISFAFLFSCIFAGEEEYSFNLSTVQKKPVQFNGYFEFRPVLSVLNRDSRAYYLNFFNIEEGSVVSEYNFNFFLNLTYEKGIFSVVTTSNLLFTNTFDGWENKISLYQAYISIKPSNLISFNLGKVRLKWGKGYAWNPVAFADRPKNPNDPELAMEGFFVFSFDYIKSFKGILQTISISPLILPVNESINPEFGNQSKLIFGGKIYILMADTDIDLMFLSGKNFADRFGIDFSRNISSSIEIHGELSYIPDLEQNERVSYLLGTRFLIRSDITFILEFYKNGLGLSSEETSEYYLQIDNAYQTYLQTGDETALKLIQETTDPVFRSFSSMSDYLYLRIIQKEPFDILYLTPSITSIYNLVDNSFSITPEVVYTPVTNLELRLKLSFFSRIRGSDFGEKQNKLRMEFRGRFYF